jgi:hypothetical protein
MLESMNNKDKQLIPLQIRGKVMDREVVNVK